MPEDPNDQEQPVSPPDATSPAADPRAARKASPGAPGTGPATASGGVRGALSRRDSKGRPVAVYAILGSVVAVLALLMVIIYFSDSERTQPDQPICTTIDATRTTEHIRQGKVETFTVGFDENAILATDPTWGPVLARIDYLDGTCAYLPQGMVNQQGIMAVIGAITFYNETTDSAQVAVVYNRMADLDPSLFAEPTSDTPHTPPTAVPATETPAPTETPSPTPTVEPASPAASPVGTPVTSPTEPPTPTP